MKGDKEKEQDDPVKAIRDNLGAAKAKLGDADEQEGAMVDDLVSEVNVSGGFSSSNGDDQPSAGGGSTQTDDSQNQTLDPQSKQVRPGSDS